uniref:TIL domain-containing protein n=1 Tax=Meloidogyne hapla TaxID=6305 RepID=A0A1I8BLN8_MELHA
MTDGEENLLNSMLIYHYPICVYEGEIYIEGCASACDPQCKYLGEKVFCILVCSPGCHCKPGYARDDNNVCIPQEDCPKKE